MITGKTPYISTVSLLNRPVTTAAAGVVSAASRSEEDINPVAATDRIHLSEPGINLLPGNPAEQDAIQSEKVRAIKQAIEEKRYHVNSRKIAEKLLRESSELMQTLTGYPLDPMQPETDSAQPGQDATQPAASGADSIYRRPTPYRT